LIRNYSINHQGTTNISATAEYYYLQIYSGGNFNNTNGTVNIAGTGTAFGMGSGGFVPNSGSLNLTGTNALYMNDGIINNTGSGVDRKSVDYANSGGNYARINNYGIIRKSEGTGTSPMSLLNVNKPVSTQLLPANLS